MAFRRGTIKGRVQTRSNHSFNRFVKSSIYSGDPEKKGAKLQRCGFVTQLVRVFNELQIHLYVSNSTVTCVMLVPYTVICAMFGCWCHTILGSCATFGCWYLQLSLCTYMLLPCTLCCCHAHMLVHVCWCHAHKYISAILCDTHAGVMYKCWCHIGAVCTYWYRVHMLVPCAHVGAMFIFRVPTQFGETNSLIFP